MKSFSFCISLLIVGSNISAQNLVPNPSFEDTVACPNSLEQISKSEGWMSFSFTPDYMNACASLVDGVSVPSNTWGYQEAFDGQAYAAIATFTTDVPNAREFLGTHLIQPLVIGVKYFLSCQISRADVLSENGATNNFGFRFSTVNHSFTDPMPVNNFSSFYSDSIIKDQTGWTLIAGSFVADSAYQYVGIGNFYDDYNTDTFQCSHEAIYYVDAVCVSADSLKCYSSHVGIAPQNQFTLYFHLSQSGCFNFDCGGDI